MFEDNSNSRIKSLLETHNRLNWELQDNIAQIYKKSNQIKKQTVLDFHNNNYKKIISDMEKMSYDDPDDLIKNL